jgi:predicted phage tail protein
MKVPHLNMAGRVIGTSLAMGGIMLAQAPDNSKTNQRDRDSAHQQNTPQNATATKEDLSTLQHI